MGQAEAGDRHNPLGHLYDDGSLRQRASARNVVALPSGQTGDYWVGDNESRYYNSLRNRASGGFRYRLAGSNINGSEYLPNYTTQYRYAVVINFNRAPD